MSSPNTKYFFCLKNYAHAAVFADIQFVWEALGKISLYLSSLSLGSVEVNIPDGVYLENREKISIGKNTIIEPGAYIRGPCCIGQNCVIRHGAYIRGNVLTGHHCVIGHDTEIKNTVMLNGSQAAHFAYLGNSILGNDVNLGAGTKCANLRLDRQPVRACFNNVFYNTGLQKLGAIIGDRAQLGCNSVVNPGSLIGQDVLGGPGVNISGFVPSNHVVYFELKPIIKKRA